MDDLGVPLFSETLICTALSKYPLATSYDTRPSLTSNTCVRDDSLAVEMMVFPSWNYHLPLWEGTSKRCSITHLEKSQFVSGIIYTYLNKCIWLSIILLQNLRDLITVSTLGTKLYFYLFCALAKNASGGSCWSQGASPSVAASMLWRSTGAWWWFPCFFSTRVPLSLVINGTITL